MAKVIGSIMVILSGLALLGQIFLYQNTSIHLPYNPATPAAGFAEVGLALPIVLSLFFFIAGVVILKTSTEPEKI